MPAQKITTTPSVRRPSDPRRRRRAWVAVPFALGAVTLALTAACAPLGGMSGAAPSAPATGTSGAVVSSATTGLGTILVTAQGRTIYDFANDKAGMSTCNGSCAQEWLPVPAPAPLPASLPSVPAAIGSTQRSDGTTQLTVAGHPVYTFAGDNAAGQTNGNGVQLNGGLWTAVSPKGAPLSTDSSTGPTGY